MQPTNPYAPLTPTDVHIIFAVFWVFVALANFSSYRQAWPIARSLHPRFGFKFLFSLEKRACIFYYRQSPRLLSIAFSLLVIAYMLVGIRG